MLTHTEYSNFRTAFAGLYPNLPNPPSYQDYQTYEHLWQKYILNNATPIIQQINPNRIGLVVMESAPGDTIHPHPNYIFNQMNNIISSGDSYIRNIYNGSKILPGLYHAGLKKAQAINDLLNSYDNNQNVRPIILMDLLPTHGIKLETEIRSKLVTGAIYGIGISIHSKFNFLNNVILQIGLSWRDVDLVFACPPKTSNNWVINQINAIAPGIFIHQLNINSGSNIAPNPNNLRNLIQNHGF